MTCDKSAARALHSPLHAQEGTSPGLADALPNVLNNDAIPGQASRTRDSLASYCFFFFFFFFVFSSVVAESCVRVCSTEAVD